MTEPEKNPHNALSNRSTVCAKVSQAHESPEESYKYVDKVLTKHTHPSMGLLTTIKSSTKSASITDVTLDYGCGKMVAMNSSLAKDDEKPFRLLAFYFTLFN